jgi:hypothetical protein
MLLLIAVPFKVIKTIQAKSISCLLMSNRKGTDSERQGFWNKKYDPKGGDYFSKTCERRETERRPFRAQRTWNTFALAKGIDRQQIKICLKN